MKKLQIYFGKTQHEKNDYYVELYFVRTFSRWDAKPVSLCSILSVFNCTSSGLSSGETLNQCHRTPYCLCWKSWKHSSTVFMSFEIGTFNEIYSVLLVSKRNMVKHAWMSCRKYHQFQPLSTPPCLRCMTNNYPDTVPVSYKWWHMLTLTILSHNDLTVGRFSQQLIHHFTRLRFLLSTFSSPV